MLGTMLENAVKTLVNTGEEVTLKIVGNSWHIDFNNGAIIIIDDQDYYKNITAKLDITSGINKSIFNEIFLSKDYQILNNQFTSNYNNDFVKALTEFKHKSEQMLLELNNCSKEIIKLEFELILRLHDIGGKLINRTIDFACCELNTNLEQYFKFNSLNEDNMLITITAPEEFNYYRSIPINMKFISSNEKLLPEIGFLIVFEIEVKNETRFFILPAASDWNQIKREFYKLENYYSIPEQLAKDLGLDF